MKGVPARAIQGLAGHRDQHDAALHVSPSALVDAIRLLDHRSMAIGFGDIILETAVPAEPIK
jgi:hypothetical protein